MVLQAELRIRASTNQRRYVVAEMMGSGSYMISMGHFVAGDLDVKRLKNAFSKVVQRHDALKTSFNLEDGEIWVAINRQAEFQFHHSISEDTGLGAFREIALPLVFNNVDPTNASSLVRLVVVQYPDAWRFTVAIHHACSDGFSRGVVNRELLKCYCNEELPETNSYYDFQTSNPICPIPDEYLYDQLRSFPEPVWIPGDGQLIEENAAQGKFVDLIVATEKSKLIPMNIVSDSFSGFPWRGICESMSRQTWGILWVQRYHFEMTLTATDFADWRGRAVTAIRRAAFWHWRQFMTAVGGPQRRGSAT